jgi:hypothetical protein
MTTQLTRRSLLSALGLGTAALIVEPVTKMWFVPSNAPVGSRIERPEFVGYHISLADNDIERAELRRILTSARIRSQAELDALRVAARRAEFVFTEPERADLLVELQNAIRARSRASRLWDPSEEYEADHYNNSAGTIVLAG